MCNKYAFRCGRNHVIKTIYRSVLIATCCFNVLFIINFIIDSTSCKKNMMLKTTLTGDRASFSLSFSVVQSDPSCIHIGLAWGHVVFETCSIKSVFQVPREVAKRSIKSVLQVPREVRKA